MKNTEYAMSKQRLYSIITDPTKREVIESWDDELINIVAQKQATQEQHKLLDSIPHAQLYHIIYRNNLVDYGSDTAKRLESIEAEFRAQTAFIPFPELLSNEELLKQTRNQLISRGAHDLKWLSEYGLEVIGGMPADEGVGLFVKHHQLVRYDYSHVVPIPNDEYSIPKLIKPATLYNNSPGRPTKENDPVYNAALYIHLLSSVEAQYYLGMTSLNPQERNWEIILT